MASAKEMIDCAAAQEARQLDPVPWNNVDRQDLDRASVCDFIHQHLPDRQAAWYPTAYVRSDEGDDLERIGLLGWLCGYRHYLDRPEGSMSAFRVSGGMSGWVEELARQVRGPIHLRHALRAVVRSGDQVWLDFGGEAKPFDRVVLAIPAPCLRDVTFEPSLTSEKLGAVAACRMSRAIKIALIYRSRWWEPNWTGYLFVDSALQQVWPAPSPASVLCAYVCGSDALTWLDRGDPGREVASEVERLVPGGMAEFVEGYVHDWLGDPFSKGAFSHLAPGYVLAHMQHIATPENRIHFAGEHTALWTGFIEGALESAERVTKEIAACAA